MGDSAIYLGTDGLPRCSWADGTPEYTGYHDDEWGRPAATDNGLFEKVTLEAFQSGLSWRTILGKRAGFRSAFHDFDLTAVAGMGEPDVARLLADASIVRHRGKIEATINNARAALDLTSEFGGLGGFFAAYADLAADHSPTRHSAAALSKELRRRGWRFVGPTTVYAFMQAAGLVNDHAAACEFYAATEMARREWLAYPNAGR